MGALGVVAVMLSAVYGDGIGAVTGAVAWGSWVILVLWSWRRRPRGRLIWEVARRRPVGDSQPGLAGQWSWSSAVHRDGVALQRVERVHDLQAWMLLRLHHPDGTRIWVWVERGSDPDRWDDLRRALWAHA